MYILPHITLDYHWLTHITHQITLHYHRLPHIIPKIVHLTPHYPRLQQFTLIYHRLPHITPKNLHLTTHYPILPYITTDYPTSPHITPKNVHLTPHYHILPYITKDYPIVPQINAHIYWFDLRLCAHAQSRIVAQVDGSGLQICIILTIHSFTLNIVERKIANSQKSRFYRAIPPPPTN